MTEGAGIFAAMRAAHVSLADKTHSPKAGPISPLLFFLQASGRKTVLCLTK